MSFGGGSGSSSIAGSTDVVLSGSANNQVLGYNSALSKWQNQDLSAANIGDLTAAVAALAPSVFMFSAVGPIAVGAGTHRVYNPTNRTLTITSTRASVSTAPTGATLIVDVNKNGTTIFTTQSNRPTIAIGGFTDVGGAPQVASWAVGEYLTIDVDQVGSTIAGADLTVQVVAT